MAEPPLTLSEKERQLVVDLHEALTLLERARMLATELLGALPDDHPARNPKREPAASK